MQILVQLDELALEALERLPYFDGLRRHDLFRLTRGCCQLAVAEGEILCRKGDPVDYVGIVVSGQFKVTLPLPDGSEKVLAFASRGDSFGEAAAVMESVNPIQVRAMRDSHVLTIERDVLMEEMARNPRLAMRVLGNVSQRLLDMVRDTETCHIRSSVERVICYLKHRAGIEPSGGAEFEFPARKKEIAANLSMTPETFSRALHALARRGAIDLRGRHVRIVNPSRLADFQPPRLDN
jgi:CRP-like cAMP-binding protein